MGRPGGIDGSAASPRSDEQDVRGAYEALFRATYPKIQSYVRRRLDEAHVDDAVSEAFLVAWRRFDEVPVDHSEALPWLYRVAEYAVLNSHRSQRRKRALRRRLGPEGPLGSLPRLVAVDDDAEALADAFASLHADERSILLLAAWEGLNNQQISEVVGCSPGAAATRLSRARMRFETASARLSGSAPGEPA